MWRCKQLRTVELNKTVSFLQEGSAQNFYFPSSNFLRIKQNAAPLSSMKIKKVGSSYWLCVNKFMKTAVREQFKVPTFSFCSIWQPIWTKQYLFSFSLYGLKTLKCTVSSPFSHPLFAQSLSHRHFGVWIEKLGTKLSAF